MRIAIVAFLAVGVIVVSAYAGGVPGPPVIHEPFTAASCPANPGTTIDSLACAGRDVLKTDRAIDTQARAIFVLMGDAATRTSFVRSEQLWLRYRRASCAVEALKYEGGSAQPVLFLDCQARRNRTHLTELRQMRQTFEMGT